MIASGVRVAIAVAALLGVAASSGADFGGGQDATAAPVVAPPRPAAPDGAIASAIANWRALGQTDALPFDSYASFLLAHPGWPGEAGLRRAAERQAAAGTGSAANVATYYRRYAPQSAGGWATFARALATVGAIGEANEAARRAWRGGSLSAGDEAYLLATFGSAFRPDDQDARMDALLWQGNAAAAQRQLALTGAARQPLYAARLSLRARAADASAVSAASAYPADAGFVADKAQYLKASGDWSGARAWLAQPHVFTAPPSDPARWLDLLYDAARGAAADGNWQVAYDIARQADTAYPIAADVGERPYGERDDYTNLVWLGATAAMKHLGRPADALVLFDRYARATRSPTVTSKGYYWAARASEAAGRSIEAAAFLATAARYRDQFYGQLAAERMGRTLQGPPPLGMASLDPGVREAFDRRETVRAARFLGQIGDHEDQTQFLRQIAQDAKSDVDHLLATELSASLNRPDLGVMIGRSALVNGLGDYSVAGFPVVQVPSGYEGSWTVIHAISRQESQFDRAAISRSGARGLMQLMPATAREQSGKIGLAYSADQLTRDPQLSMMLGSSYFARLYQRFGSYPLAIAAYNAGGGNVNKWLATNGDPRTGAVDMIDWIEAIPFSETRSYVQRVLENAVVYDLISPERALSRSSATPLSWYLGKSRAG